jgi:hypothetical protein
MAYKYTSLYLAKKATADEDEDEDTMSVFMANEFTLQLSSIFQKMWRNNNDG